MDHLGTNSTPALDTHSAPEPSAGSIHQSSEALPPSPALKEGSLDYLQGWKTIGEQGFCDEDGFLYPSCNLTSEKLKDRKEDDVVIFNYSSSRADGNPLVEGGGPSSGSSGEIGDMFFQVSKDRLTESEQFNQAINPAKGPRPAQSQEQLATIDFPQCYDAYDDNLLNSMAKALHLPNPATFGQAHSRKVLTLPGRGRFRTGFSLRLPSNNPSELAKPGSLEDRITLFVSFPYFGKSRSSIPFGPESESVELLDFKRLGVDVPDRGAVASGGDKDDTGEILVHQARYMIFDNYTMATFRSKEDSVKDQIPLHCFQEHVSAFRAMIHMIANHTGSELWALGELQASLCTLEEDVDRIIWDAKAFEDNQGMENIPDDYSLGLALPRRGTFMDEEKSIWEKGYEEARQEKVRRRKKRRVRGLLTFLNRLSANLFAAISVAERQVAVLHDLRTLFTTRGQAKTQDCEGGNPLWQNPSLNIDLTTILSKNSEQMWHGDWATIDEVVRERKSFVQKIKLLVENMEIRREILFGFLRSDKTKAAPPSDGTAQEMVEAIKRSHYTQLQQAQQAQALSVFTAVTTAFLPLSFCASYFGMNNIKEFNDNPLSIRDFWAITGPVCAGITLLSVIIILWGRLRMFIWYSRLRLYLFAREKMHDIENQLQKFKPHRD